MNIPKVSIVITTRNRPGLLKRALGSALHQMYQNFEIHVVDDASSDDQRCSIENLFAGCKKVHYWCHGNRRGLAAARNTGIAKSSGDYIAFLDDDDEWKPECVTKRIALLQDLPPDERKRLGVVYCGCEIRILHENRITYSLPKMQGNIKDFICAHGPSTIPSSCLFPKEVLERIGGFDEHLLSSIDHDIWMNLATQGYYACSVKEPLVITYHVRRRNSMVTDMEPRIQGVEQFLKKWRVTYEEWFGREGARRFIRHYRTRVLGDLAGKKLIEGELRESTHLMFHVIDRNGWSISSSSLLIWLVGRNIVRMLLPSKVIEIAKKNTRLWY